MQPIPPGQIIAGRYRVQSVLGVGGHACVYLAQQEGLERKVAIKVLNTENVPKVEVLMKRFEQEARLISQLRDPHTITMYDYGQTPEGGLYMVQEYVEGEPLSDLYKREGKLEPKRVVKIVNQILLSLQEAHALGVLHRDIKPQNIMVYSHVGRRDQVKLLDFGIAKMVGEAGQDWTAEGSLVGTPRYIAPERIRGKKLSPSSDIYAVGLVAYELLTGRRVLEGKKGIAALQSQLSDPSTKLDPGLAIPGALRQIIDKMMEKDVPRRYTTAEQVLEDLEDWKDPAIGGATVVQNPDPAALHAARQAMHAAGSSSDALFSRGDLVEGDPTLVGGNPPSEVAALRQAAQSGGYTPPSTDQYQRAQTPPPRTMPLHSVRAGQLPHQQQLPHDPMRSSGQFQNQQQLPQDPMRSSGQFPPQQPRPHDPLSSSGQYVNPPRDPMSSSGQYAPYDPMRSSGQFQGQQQLPHDPMRSSGQFQGQPLPHDPMRSSGQFQPQPRRNDSTVPFDRSMRDQLLADSANAGPVADITNDSTHVLTVSDRQIANAESGASQELPTYPHGQHPQMQGQNAHMHQHNPNPMGSQLIPAPPNLPAQESSSNAVTIAIIALLALIALAILGAAAFLFL